MEDKPTWIPFRDTEITCPHCNKRVSFKVFDAEREIEDLNSQLTQCQERLAEAERLLTELERLTGLMSGPGMTWDRNDLSKLHGWIIDFLSPTTLENKP